jgi:hypothetical protein
MTKTSHRRKNLRRLLRMRADGYEFIATEHGCGWLKKLSL